MFQGGKEKAVTTGLATGFGLGLRHLGRDRNFGVTTGPWGSWMVLGRDRGRCSRRSCARTIERACACHRPAAPQQCSRQRVVLARQRAVRTRLGAVHVHCAHDPPAVVHCAVHCLGHCLGHSSLKKKKKKPPGFGASQNP